MAASSFATVPPTVPANGDHAFKTKRDWVYERLKGDIANGNLGPGARLVVSHLTAMYMVSPSPVRDAISRLAQEGFVEITPHAGASVTSIDGKKLYDLVFLRMKLEALAAELAVPLLAESSFTLLDDMHRKMQDCAAINDRLTYEAVNWNFHDHIYANCGNGELYDLVMSLWRKSCITRTIFVRLPAQLEYSIAEHQKWLDAAKTRNGPEVHRIVQGHIRHTLERLGEIVKQRPAS